MQAFLQKITAFFMSLIAFFSGLLVTVRPVQYTYGAHERAQVNIMLPKNAQGTTRGLVFFIHGGAWVGGDKDDFGSYLKNTAARGYVVAALNYRYISDDSHCEEILEDIDAALIKVKEVAEQKNITVEKALFTGVSAGAHLALLYAYSRADTSPIAPAAVVSYCGPTDLADPGFIDGNAIGEPEAMLDLLSKLCGVKLTEEEYRARSGNYDAWLAAIEKVSPVSYVTESSVPTVIAHGEQDTLVPYANAVKLDALLTSAGVKHEFVSFPNSGHELGYDPECWERVGALLNEYEDTYLK